MTQEHTTWDSISGDYHGVIIYGKDNRGRYATEKEMLLMTKAPQLLEALKAIVDMEVETAESGDHGFYDPEKIPQVIQARAAIAAADGGDK
jgi:hypothetical protein